MKKFLHKYFGATKWKRLFDIVASFISLIVLSPLFLFIMTVNFFTPNTKVFFSHERRGRSGKPFRIYKFQTMKNDTPNCATGELENPEQYITKFGAILRKTSMDELPQLWNTLKGDMSLVGPRPEIPYYVEQFREIIPSYMMKHYVKPGMTGWAQIHGLRGNTSIPKRIRYDMEYIENWSLLLDLKILILTVVHGIFNKNAY